MSDDSFVGIDVTGIPEINSKLGKLPQEAQDQGVEMVDEYLVNSLRQYPPYTHVSRAEAWPSAPGGSGWQSDKQRRYVMAQIRSSGIRIPYGRTQALAQAWQKIGFGIKSLVVNDLPYAKWIYDIATQSQMMMLKGWQVIPEFIAGRMGEILRRFDAGVQKAIRKLGL